MSITTYAELQAAIASWSSRTDLTAVIPDFITLAESKFNRRLRTHWQEVALTASPISTTFTITRPPEAVAVKSFWPDGHTTIHLEQQTIEHVVKNQAVGSIPKFYCWQGADWLFDGAGADVTGVYFEKVPALTDSAPTNWLLTNFPDCYLFACLEQAAIKAQDVNGELKWQQKSDALIDEINGTSNASQVSGGKLVARAR